MTKNEKRRKAAERRIANRQRANAPPRRQRFSVETVGVVGAATATAWATVAEFAPLAVKAVGGTAVAVVGAVAAVKALVEKRRQDREEDK